MKFLKNIEEFIAESVVVKPTMNKVEKLMYDFYNKHINDRMMCYKFTSIILNKATGVDLNKIMKDSMVNMGTEDDTKKLEILKNGGDNIKGIAYAIVKNGLGQYVDANQAVAGDFVQVWFIPKHGKEKEVYITKPTEIKDQKLSIETGIFNDKHFSLSVDKNGANNFLLSKNKKQFVKDLFKQNKIVLSKEEISDIDNNEQKLFYQTSVQNVISGHSGIVQGKPVNNVLPINGYGEMFGANFYKLSGNQSQEIKGMDYTDKYDSIPLNGTKDYEVKVFVARLNEKYLK